MPWKKLHEKGTDRQIYPGLDIATTRNNRPKGRCFQNLAYGRHWISRPMRIVSCVIQFKPKKKKITFPQKNCRTPSKNSKKKCFPRHIKNVGPLEKNIRQNKKKEKKEKEKIPPLSFFYVAGKTFFFGVFGGGSTIFWGEGNLFFFFGLNWIILLSVILPCEILHCTVGYLSSLYGPATDWDIFF